MKVKGKNLLLEYRFVGGITFYFIYVGDDTC